MTALRFDWLHRYDEGDERRGAGLWINFPVGKDSRVALSAGAAFDSPSGKVLPFTGSLTWTKNIGIGKENRGYEH